MNEKKVIPFHIPQKGTRPLESRQYPNELGIGDLVKLPRSMKFFFAKANYLLTLLRKRIPLSSNSDVFSELSAQALDARMCVSGYADVPLKGDTATIAEIRAILDSDIDNFDFIDFVERKIREIKHNQNTRNYSSLYDNLYGVIFWPLIFRSKYERDDVDG